MGHPRCTTPSQAPPEYVQTSSTCFRADSRRERSWTLPVPVSGVPTDPAHPPWPLTPESLIAPIGDSIGAAVVLDNPLFSLGRLTRYLQVRLREARPIPRLLDDSGPPVLKPEQELLQRRCAGPHHLHIPLRRRAHHLPRRLHILPVLEVQGRRCCLRH